MLFWDWGAHKLNADIHRSKGVISSLGVNTFGENIDKFGEVLISIVIHMISDQCRDDEGIKKIFLSSKIVCEGACVRETRKDEIGCGAYIDVGFYFHRQF